MVIIVIGEVFLVSLFWVWIFLDMVFIFVGFFELDKSLNIFLGERMNRLV